MWLKALAALPVAHLVLCSIYLYFLTLGFGGNVGELLTASDILRVGINEVAPSYIIFGAGVGIIYLWMDEEPLSIRGKQEFRVHESLSGKWMDIVFFSIPAIILLNQLVLIIVQKKVLIQALLIAPAFIIALIIRKVIQKNQFVQIYGFFILLVLLGVIQISASAYAEGFASRHHEFGSFDDRVAVCGTSNKLLFVISEWQIVVNPDGTRLGYSNDCEQTLTFEPRNVLLDTL